MSRVVKILLITLTLIISVVGLEVVHCQTVSTSEITPIVYAYWLEPKVPSPGTSLAILKVGIVIPNISGVKFYFKDVRVWLELPDNIEWFSGVQICKIPYMAPGMNSTCIFYLRIPPTVSTGFKDFKIETYYYICIVTQRGQYCTHEHLEYTQKLPIIGTSGIQVLGAYLGYKNYQIVGPGMKNIPLTIIVMNSGTSILENVTIQLKLSYPIYATKNGKIVKYLNITLPALPPGKPITLTYLVNLYNNVTGGCYSEKLFVKYGIGVTWTLNTSFRLCIPEVKFSAVTAYWGFPGKVFSVGPGYSKIPLTVMFIPTSAIDNLTVCIRLEKPLKGSGLLCKNIGVVTAGREIPVTFIVSTLQNISGGKYPIQVIFMYDHVREVHTVKIVIYSPKIRVAYAIPMPPIATPGMNGIRLNVSIVNVGSVIAKNVTIRLVLPREFSTYTPNMTSITLPAVPPGKPIPIQFMFNVPDNVTPRTYILKINVHYCDVDEDYYVTFKVIPKPEFKVVKIEEIGFYPGSSRAILRIYLKYVRGPTLENVKAILSIPKVLTFHVPQNNPLAAMTANQIYVGEVRPGDTIVLTYLLEIDSSTPVGIYHATLMLLYSPKPFIIYGLNSIPTLVKSITLNIKIGETMTTIMYKHLPEIICVIFAIIAIIAIAIARARRRRRQITTPT